MSHRLSIGNRAAITDAINEALVGNHVAHAESSDGKRTVAIRPWALNSNGAAITLTYRFGPAYDEQNIACSSPLVAAATLAILLTYRHKLSPEATQYREEVNQKVRTCYIIERKKTRLRIEYDLPNAGPVGAWRGFAVIGNDLFVQGVDYFYIA